MKNFYIISLIILVISGIIVFSYKSHIVRTNIPAVSQNDQSAPENAVLQNQGAASSPSQNDNILNNFKAPLDRTPERVTKKPFGIYITPDTSPVQPERFRGYHTGTDFEIFSEELNVDISIKAVCSGKILLKKNVSGYGGVVVELCELENNPITIIYGHLKLSSISLEEGNLIDVGDAIGILGKANSVETDGERKHLHLGFHRGTVVDVQGYVSSESDLSSWLDPCDYICLN